MIESFQLAVIGAGPGGLKAANSAAELGVRTILIDSYPQPGGQYFMQPAGSFSATQLTKTEAEGQNLIQELKVKAVTTLVNTLVWGIFKEGSDTQWLVGLYGKEKPYYIRADHLILASGAYDSPVAFPGWTLPGVITCGAALILLKSQRMAPGTRVLVSGTGPLLLSVGAHLISAGVEDVTICEANHFLPKGLKYATTMLGQRKRLAEGIRYYWQILRTKTPYKIGWSVQAAIGSNKVEQAIISRLSPEGNPIEGSQIDLDVDLVVIGYSLTPNTGLVRMLGCEMKYQAEKGGWIPVRKETLETSREGVFCIGDGAAIGGAENAQLEGQIAAWQIAHRCGKISAITLHKKVTGIKPYLRKQQQFGRLYANLFTPPATISSLARDDTLLCRCEEVTLVDVKKAVAMGARTMGEVKMLTRTGMGNCQGRMCECSVSAAIVTALAAEKMRSDQVGYYSIRPPLHPLPSGFLAKAQIDDV